MDFWRNYFLKILLLGLTANVIIFIYNNLYKETTPEPSTPTQYGGITECCKQICDQNTSNSHDFLKNEKAKKLLHESPTLGYSYLKNTLVRLGSDLNIDLKTCPKDSLMLHPNKNFIPDHLDCPTLFLIGARKGGTSSLYHYISKHPDFRGTKLDAGPKVGETFYFTAFYTKRSWKQYLSLFPRGGVMTGDASVGNLVHPLAPRRLHKSCWKLAKVVVLLRDPVSRFRSNFLMRVRLKSGTESFAYSSVALYLHKQLNEFLKKMLYKSTNLSDVKKEWSKYVGLFKPAENLIYEGIYYVHLMNWLCNFPAENIMILNSEEFYRSPSTILDLVFQFLDLKRLDDDSYHWITSTTYNKGKYNASASHTISHSDEALLRGTYKSYNLALMELLQWKSVKWII